MLFCPQSGAVTPDPTDALNAKIIRWAQSNLANYQKYVDFAKHGPQPQVPVPPMVDMPCHECDDMSTSTQGEAQVATWVKQSQEPEMTYINALLDISKQLALIESTGPGTLSPAAQQAIKPFSAQEADDAAIKLADRLLDGKAIPMANQYDQEPKQAYAGILFLLAVSKDDQLIQGLPGGSGNAANNQIIPLAETWEQSIAKKIDDDILSGHKYNLCPVYAQIYHDVEMLGGPETDIAKYTETVLKIQKLLHFNVQMSLHVTGGDDGSQMNLDWRGTATMSISVDAGKGCYTPQFDNGGKMDIDVVGFNMVTKDGTHVELTSPSQFEIKLLQPKLNLCDPNPVLQIPFDTASIPLDALTALGRTSKAQLFGGFLMAVVGLNDVNTAPANAVTGNPNTGGGKDSAPLGTDAGNTQARSAAASAAADNPKVTADLALLGAHQKDAAWMMSAEGQAVVAKIQKDALEAVTPQLGKLNTAAGQATNAADIMKAFSSAQVPWANGSANPVSKFFNVDKDSAHMFLAFSVSQAPQ